jgi:hypothetical protein
VITSLGEEEMQNDPFQGHMVEEKVTSFWEPSGLKGVIRRIS